MPEPVTAPNTQSPPQPEGGAPQPQPQPQQQQPPAPKPAQQTPAHEPARPELTPDTILTFTGSDGTAQRKTIQELIDASSRPSGPQMDQDQLEAFNLWQRASQNDPEAMRALIDRAMPTQQKPAPQPGTVEHKLAEMEQRYAKLEDELQRASKVTTEIDMQRGRVYINDQVKRAADHLPHLTKMPDPSQVVVRHMINAKNHIQSRGGDPSANPEAQRQVMVLAMSWAENELAGYAKAFGVQGQQANGQPKPINNDQTVGPQKMTGPPPGLMMWDDGTLRDQYGRIHQQQSHGALAPLEPGAIPGQIPGVPAGGAPVGLPGAPNGQAGNQRFTENSLAAKMRARANELKAAVGQ